MKVDTYIVTETNAATAKMLNPNAQQIHKINCSRYDQNLRTL